MTTDKNTIAFLLEIANAAKEALAIQDACNLSGVLHAWAKVQPLIRDIEPSRDAQRKHPLNILYASKVSSLMGVYTDCVGSVGEGAITADPDAVDLFRGAYDWAHKAQQGGK